MEIEEFIQVLRPSRGGRVSNKGLDNLTPHYSVSTVGRQCAQTAFLVTGTFPGALNTSSKLENGHTLVSYV